MIIAIDGPAGSGKTTTAREVARRLGMARLDTGAMYRAITLGVLEAGLDPQDSKAVEDLLDSLQVDMNGDRVFLNGKDVTDRIRLSDVTEAVSPVSAMKAVRKKMVCLQREIGRKQDCVVDGRDIGTVVFPDADYKFFLVADIRVRAERRLKEQTEKGEKLSLDDVMHQIDMRDRMDSSRDQSPLKKADDAIEINTSDLTIDQQVQRIIDKVESNPNDTMKESLMTEEKTVEQVETENPQEPVIAEAEKKSIADPYDMIKKVTRDQVEEINEEKEEIDEELETLYNRTLKKFNDDKRVMGHVIRVGEKDVVVDIGFKSEGMIPLEEFGDNIPEVGEQIEIYVDKIEDQHGQLVLSKKKADFLKSWEVLKQKYADNDIIEGKIIKRIKGGMVVDLNGVEAFLPGSQIDVRPITDFDAYIGKTMDFKIVKLNEARKNIVVSHKEIKEEALKEKREELLSQIQVDQVLKGRVKNITDFGVFVDLGGVDGLLHITDMSWGRINHPSEMVKVDDIIEVKVIDYDTEKQRVSLGLKQLTPHPWDEIEQRYPIGSVVKGRAVSITNYGIFVELEKGVEGLIHISELSWTQHIKHPSELFSLNDEIEAKVLSIDSEERKISLGVKQLQPDPWESIEQRYTEGMQVKGVVRNLTQFGAFVELEEGIDGLVHVSDLSWTRKIRHPKEVLQKGQEVEVVILEVNTGSRKISLGIKQLEANPWDVIEEKYKPGSMAKGEVLKILEKGVIVQLEENVEGLIPMGDMSKKDRKNYTKAVKVGEDVELRVEKVDRDERKVILSRDDLIMNEEEKEIAKVISSQENATQKIEIPEDILNKLQTEEKIAEAEEKEKPAKKKAESKKKSPKKAEKKADKESDQPEEAPAEETSEAADKVEDKVEDKKEEAVESKAADAKEIAEEDVEKEAAGKKE
ncbi:MAG: 30S ribosomal protein S1 [Candidatus Marinimicrobia bacterium]|nr:30S ribosomal protein S1 [Candidatus Neomarinimicrobiota bacterium]